MPVNLLISPYQSEEITMRPSLTSTLTSLAFVLTTACTSLPLMTRSIAYDPVTTDSVNYDTEYPPAAIELTIMSQGARLPGLLYLANGPGPHPTVVLAHGYPGNEKNLDVAHSLRRAGYNVLFFHYRGAWGAEGNYSLTNLHEDVLAALAHLRDPEFATANRIDIDHMSLIGHSMGGYAVLRAASADEPLQCVAGLSSANLAVIADSLAASPEFASGFSEYTDGLFMLKGYSGAKALHEIADNRAAFDPAGFTGGLKGKSVLLLTGDKDTTTPADTMQAPMVDLYSAEAEINLSHAVIPGDHSYSWSRQTLTVHVLDWLNDNCR